MEKEMSGELFKLLACPVCKADLQYSGSKLVCKVCRLEYAVKDGIPVMIVKSSKKKK